MTQTNGLRNPGFWCAALVLIVAAPAIGANDAPGWHKAGDHPNDYDMGNDPSVSLHGKSSGYIKNNKPEPGGFGTYMQMFDAADFRGKRVQFSAFVRTENVENWASLWMRVDGEDKAIAFDNMQKRAIKGTQTWTRYAVVLDVDSAKAKRIAIGVLLAGKGTVWIDDVRFETVGENVPVTDIMVKADPLRSGPRLSFDK